ncbi:hypothetical protein O6H91_03G034300 [Diphasiastrum complanatum]|uniref:Uncharacterized protein n=1 Tax=Diphasiastrum complanatum TaxID=34168 RepID=A0ACC2E5R2_DIPCM|nr:hypothetical protein O6H91_03G034300 [Diphasiastrum complanatum]
MFLQLKVASQMALNKRKACTTEAVFILGSLMLLGSTVHTWKTAAMYPPPGNSLFMKAKTQNGRQMYQCSSKKWVASGANADLVMANNLSHHVGLFISRVLQTHAKSQGTWVLDNSVGDTIESGSNFSSVSGKEIASTPSKGFILQTLIQATSHQFDGTASLISYIQQLFPKGGIPPLQETCDEDLAEVEVPYEAEYWLWQQDWQPPSMPKSLLITSERVVEGLFGEGIVLYRFNGQAWEQIRVEASLYNLPGGILAGKYFWKKSKSIKSDEINWWQLWNPNSFQLQGRAQSAAVSVTRDGLPWCLFTVTHHFGNVSLLGEYTHVQILSTRGGVPLSHSAFKPTANMLWRAPFSAVFWFYTN